MKIELATGKTDRELLGRLAALDSAAFVFHNTYSGHAQCDVPAPFRRVVEVNPRLRMLVTVNPLLKRLVPMCLFSNFF